MDLIFELNNSILTLEALVRTDSMYNEYCPDQVFETNWPLEILNLNDIAKILDITWSCEGSFDKIKKLFIKQLFIKQEINMENDHVIRIFRLMMLYCELNNATRVTKSQKAYYKENLEDSSSDLDGLIKEETDSFHRNYLKAKSLKDKLRKVYRKETELMTNPINHDIIRLVSL